MASNYVNKTDGKFNHGKWIREKSQEINEISTKAGLEDVIKGSTSAIEGIKMSKEVAQGLQDWIARSPYGRKYGKQINKGRIHSVIGPADVMGIERYLSPAGKKEWKELSAKHKPKREAVTERLSRQAAQRMDGLHNVEDMKVILRRVGIFYRELSIDLEDEGFEKDEILEFFIAKIKNAI